MNDARFDRTTSGDAAGDAGPTPDPTITVEPDEHGVVPARDWTRRRRGRFESPLLVHWIDEKGSVVRLLSSGDSELDARGA
jgi:hypothetical protein